jgi:opacity protein-like surface antigen
MRKMILGAASALALASPAVAADLPVTPYSEAPSYEREVPTYGYRTAPPVVVEESAPIVIRRPVVVAPPVVVEEYPVYAAPRPVYATAPVYAYARPVWHHGWGHRGHFRGHW